LGDNQKAGTKNIQWNKKTDIYLKEQYKTNENPTAWGNNWMGNMFRYHYWFSADKLLKCKLLKWISPKLEQTLVKVRM